MIVWNGAWVYDRLLQLSSHGEAPRNSIWPIWVFRYRTSHHRLETRWVFAKLRAYGHTSIKCVSFRSDRDNSSFHGGRNQSGIGELHFFCEIMVFGYSQFDNVCLRRLDRVVRKTGAPSIGLWKLAVILGKRSCEMDTSVEDSRYLAWPRPHKAADRDEACWSPANGLGKRDQAAIYSSMQ